MAKFILGLIALVLFASIFGIIGYTAGHPSSTQLVQECHQHGMTSAQHNHPAKKNG